MFASNKRFASALDASIEDTDSNLMAEGMRYMCAWKDVSDTVETRKSSTFNNFGTVLVFIVSFIINNILWILNGIVFSSVR